NDRRIIQHRGKFAIELVDDDIGKTGRRCQALAGRDVEAGKTGFGHGRCIGQTEKSIRSRHREGTKLAALNVGYQRRWRIQQKIEASSEEIGDGGSTAAIWHVL